MVGLASFLTVRHFSTRHACIFDWTVAATRAARAAVQQTAVPIASQRVGISAPRNGSGDCPPMYLSLPEPQSPPPSCWSAASTNRSRHRVAASWRLAFDVHGAKRHVCPARDDRNARPLVSHATPRVQAPIDRPVRDVPVIKTLTQHLYRATFVMSRYRPTRPHNRHRASAPVEAFESQLDIASVVQTF
jgi:hypothetical protein